MRPLTDVIRWTTTRDEDILGFEREVIAPYLPYTLAQPWLKPDADRDAWDADVVPYTEENITQDMREYMVFAWDKAQNHREISASRSIQKMRVWCYMLGREDLVAVCDDASLFPWYGAPILARLCEAMGFPVPDDPDLVRMMTGHTCADDCASGCHA